MKTKNNKEKIDFKHNLSLYYQRGKTKVNLKQLESVMKTYGKAWETQDTELLLSIFTKNGTYQESPLAKPYKGHKQIAKFWDRIVVGKTKNIKFKLGKCYLSSDKKTGFAEWECKCSHKQTTEWIKDHMVGIMILKMKDSKITNLNEYWNTKSK